MTDPELHKSSLPPDTLAKLVADKKRDRRRFWMGVLLAVAVHVVFLGILGWPFGQRETQGDIIICPPPPLTYRAGRAADPIVPTHLEASSSSKTETATPPEHQPADHQPTEHQPTGLSPLPKAKPNPVSMPNPECTDTALRAARLQGMVILKLTILPTGEVSSVKVHKGMPFGLTQESVKAAETWRFEPWDASDSTEPALGERLALITFKNCSVTSSVR